MNQGLMPVLAQREDMRIVEVDGQPVVTARDLARALGYIRDDSVLKVFERNRTSFREVKGTVNLTVPFDTGVVKLTTPSGEQQVRFFTKCGALKVCMKSNQPRAVAVQEALIDLYEQVERGELVSRGHLHDVVRELKMEINRLSEIVTAAGISPGPKVVYLPRPKKRHSFDDAALAFLQELFNRKPYARAAELERQLRKEAAKQDWKVGTRASVYRAVVSFREKTWAAKY